MSGAGTARYPAGGYPKLDAGPGMPAQKIVDDDLLDRVHWLVSHPVAAYLVRPEGCGRADTGQMHPRGQSLGNQNIGA